MNDLPVAQASGCLDGKIALLIGASRGIGAQTAKVLARSGAKVVLAARDEVALAAVVAEIKAAGYEARGMRVRRAIGSWPRAIITSSPASTFASSSESRVLPSPTLTVTSRHRTRAT